MDVLLTFSVHKEFETQLKSIICQIKKISIVTSFNCVVTNHIIKCEKDITKLEEHLQLTDKNESNKGSENQEVTVKVEPADVLENHEEKQEEKPDTSDLENEEKYEYEEFDLISDLKGEDEDIINSEDEEISCKVCRKEFKTSQGFISHVCLDDEKVKKRFCDVCKKLFRDEAKLAKHKCGSVEHKCDVCGEDLKYKYKLRKHLKAVHDIERNDRQKPKRKKCPICGKETFGLKHHIRAIHQGIKKEIAPVVCDICGTNYSSKGALSLHQQRIHQEVERALPCEICNKKFRFSVELKQHMRVHENVKYPCHICGKLLCRKQALQDHIATVHENIRNFKCDMCDEAFYRAKALDDHKKIVHIKSLDFCCDICGKKYSCSRALGKHIRESHADKYECDICGQNFTNASSLRDHKNRHLRKYVCEICSAVFGNVGKLKKHLTNVHKIDELHEAWKKSIEK